MTKMERERDDLTRMSLIFCLLSTRVSAKPAPASLSGGTGWPLSRCCERESLSNDRRCKWLDSFIREEDCLLQRIERKRVSKFEKLLRKCSFCGS